ncbi:C2H2-type zinc finger protein [Haladaptatus salinisoli]|uniref:C2H2-type zinc finger protein n=1 Tax=Haladaptatus salinisoli TaxID=2884876 RepID=UPI001D0B35F9|nr:C2H2-type zinc finger protein [Haladaptatus salinisoli]
MTLDTSVPAGESPHECSRCGMPFRHEDHLVLHRGLEHGDDLSEAEVAAFRDAYEAESEELRLFRLKALALLVLLYFGFLFTYSFVT